MNRDDKVFGLKLAGALAVVAVVTAGYHNFTSPKGVVSIQRGYRGLGAEVYYTAAKVDELRLNNQSPAAEPKQDPSGTPASQVYQNVKVLGKLDSNEVLRLMASVANWVAPVQQCAYCHNTDNLAYDAIYTKIVARRMFQMVQHINRDWTQHVKATGVTCWTCHRGNPVPSKIWFNAPDPQPREAEAGGGALEVNQGKNLVSPVAAYSALPYDPLTPFLEVGKDIRVQVTTALPGTSRNSIKQAEWTYAMMMQISDALGVNCNYCHATRAFWDYSQSFPQKATAWYGIRMVRDLNQNFMDPLKKVFPANRLGPTGDAPKIQCATCHKGVYKPLFAVSLAKEYPELGANGQIDTKADIGSIGDYKDK